MQMHKKIIPFNDIYALGDIKPEDLPSVMERLKQYSQILNGISEESKRTPEYGNLIKTIKELQQKLGILNVTPGFVRINPGEFVMGAKDVNNNPPHKVTITRPFEMAQYQVTQEEFLKFKKDHEFVFPGLSKNPAEKVTWTEAVKYCKWLSMLADDIEQSYKNAVKELSPEDYMTYAFEHPEARLYRLPKEAEWEYACRNEGRSTSHEMYIDLGQYAVYDSESTKPVGNKKPNVLGLYDMLGNVWEWCADQYEKDISADTKDPKGPKSDLGRVLRGGGWNNKYGHNCDPANRLNYDQDTRHDNAGFRPSRTVE
jgi:sulfatase modifying factor 1